MLRPRHLWRLPTHLYIHLKVSLSKKVHLSGLPPRGAEEAPMAEVVDPHTVPWVVAGEYRQPLASQGTRGGDKQLNSRRGAWESNISSHLPARSAFFRNIRSRTW